MPNKRIQKKLQEAKKVQQKKESERNALKQQFEQELKELEEAMAKIGIPLN